MENTNDKETTLLARWMSGNISEEEQIKLDKDPNSSAYKKIAEASKQLYFEKPDLDKQYEALLSKRDGSPSLSKKTNYITWLYSAAAIVIAIFGINYFLSAQSQIDVITEIAQNKEITLPDGSIVNLNSSSVLSFNEKEFLTKRELILDGEAYFEVKKGSSFIVHTSNGSISVLGTSFNVYSRDNDITVFCDEGRVQVQRAANLIVLNPGEGAFAKANTPLTSTPTSKQSPQWRSGTTYFQKEQLRDVFKELERQYPVTLNIEDVNLDRRYNGYFSHSNLEDALKEISEIMQIKYTIDGNIVTVTSEK